MTFSGSQYPLNIIVLLITCALFSACSSEAQINQSDSAAKGYSDISATDAGALVAKSGVSGGSVRVIDTRTPAEFNRGHIKGALLIDYRASDFKQQLAKLDRDLTYLLHCKSGGRSSRAIATFKELGFSNVVHMPEGYDGWVKAGFPVAN